MAVVEVQTAFPAANARSAAASSAAEQAHSGWARAGYSAGPSDDWAPAGYSAAPSASDWDQLGSVPAGYSVQAGRNVPLRFLVARLLHCLAARRLDLPENCKEFLRLWRV